MSLIMDILKRAQQLRQKGVEGTPVFRDIPSNKQRGKSSKRQWGLLSAGLISLCILLLVLLRTCISPFTTKPDQAIVSREGKASLPIPDKKSPEPDKEGVGLQEDEDPETSGQALNPASGGTGSWQADTERPPYGGGGTSSRPYSRQEEEGRLESKRPLTEKKRASLIKQISKEEIPSNSTGVQQEGGKDHTIASDVLNHFNMDFPIGTVISNGNVKMEVKDNVWRTVESPYAPILKGKKIKIEKGAAKISLSNNTLIEVSQNSLLSLEHEGQLNLLEGGIHFRIPSTAQMNFKIGALSVTKPYPLNTQAGPTTAFIGQEETRGFLLLHPEGSLTVRSVQGSLSILDHENRVLTTTSSREPITIPPKILSGEEPWMAEQRTGIAANKMEETFQAPVGKDKTEVGELEKYLIEFSIHLEGKDLPAHLDAQKFFSLLEAVYPHQDIIEKVKQYPVKVRRKRKSYILTLCDKQSEWMLYRDLGETTHIVDNIYWPDGLTVPCPRALPPYGLLAIPAAAIATGVLLEDGDDGDAPPLCR